MNATVNNDWVEYLEPSEQVKLGRRWQWQVPNDYPKAVADELYGKGLIDSKQTFISVCISQTGTPMNPAGGHVSSPMENVIVYFR